MTGPAMQLGVALVLGALAGMTRAQSDEPCDAGDELCQALNMSLLQHGVHLAAGSAMATEDPEAKLAKVFRSVAEGRAASVPLQDVMPELTKVMATKARANEQQVADAMKVVDSNGNGLLESKEMHLALGMGEPEQDMQDKANPIQPLPPPPSMSADTANPIPHLPPPPSANASMLELQANKTTGWQSYHCCGNFYADQWKDVFFKPQIKLTSNVANPKACHIIAILPGQNCIYAYQYTNSDPNDGNDPSGGLCRCTTTSWADLTFYVSGVGNDIFWVR
uniref:EF-hand domain-containing protein n=1 Tax=Pyrodinium bahamense TaxID=73915 RepID=A0A7R9ZW72_9DINO